MTRREANALAVTQLIHGGRHVCCFTSNLPCYIMPFGQVFIVQIQQNWYHIKAESIAYISYATCMGEILIVFMLEREIDGSAG